MFSMDKTKQNIICNGELFLICAGYDGDGRTLHQP